MSSPLRAARAEGRTRAEVTDAPPALAAAPNPFAGLSRADALALHNRMRGDPYALDSIERFLDSPGEKLPCDTTGLLSYSGSIIKYAGPVRVNEAFTARLQRFEELVVSIATETYGRAPRRIRHMGAYSCRKSRNRRQRISEHAFGNAIDITGFDFAGAEGGEAVPDGVPSYLRGPFQVRVNRHWRRDGAPAWRVHARFLEVLAQRIVARGDVFRIVVGPGHRGHGNHFHFDMSPWHYTDL